MFLSRKKYFFSILIVYIILYPMVNASAIIIDKIMAKVNDEIISQSEVEEQIDALREELLRNYKPEDVENVIKKQRIEILGKIIEAKIMLQEAKKLNVVVNENEINKEVEKNISKLKEQIPDEAKYLEYLNSKGLNPDSLKEKLYKTISEDMIIQRLIFREVRSQIDVTESEIKEYFLHLGEETHARHILIKILPDADSKQEKEVKKKIEEIYQNLVDGADFKELAIKNSEDSRASEGGDLGFFKRGDMIPEFEEVLQKLKVGEFSEPVRTRYGYHIIFVEERKIHPKEEEVHARHLLVKTEEEAKILKKKLQKNIPFESLVKESSLDSGTKDKGGDLGFFKKNMMIEGFGEAAFNLKSGEISDPVKTSFGYHIIQTLEKRYVQFDSLHEDIKNSLLQSKMEARYIKWLNTLRYYTNMEIMK